MLLEDLDLDRLSAAEALREIQRIADATVKEMSPGYYVARLAAISQLATIAAGT